MFVVAKGLKISDYLNLSINLPMIIFAIILYTTNMTVANQ